jgi:hypothetical protein
MSPGGSWRCRSLALSGGFGGAELDRHGSLDHLLERELPSSRLRVETTSRVLRYAFSAEWCGDAITIGYRCEIFVAV